MRYCKYIFFLLVSLFVFWGMEVTAAVVNNYTVTPPQNNHTYLDSSIYQFTTYFANKKNNLITIEKEYDHTSYRLDKYLLQLIDYTNQTDTAVTLKFYSTEYYYCFVGEVDKIVSDKILIKSSGNIKSEEQFYEVKILPKSIVHAFLLYRPVSFKDYPDNKDALFRYTNKYLFPEFDNITYRENIGFAVLMLVLLGMVFILFIFYGLAYLNLKDQIYLSYSMYLFVTFFQVLYMSQYIFSKNFVMFNYFGNSGFDEVTKGLMIVCYSIFYKQAFNITKEQKVLYISVESLKYFSYAYILIIVISYLFRCSWYNEQLWYTLYRFPIFFFSIIVLIYSVLLKQKTGFQRLILIGSLIYTLFTAFTTFQKTDFPVKDLLPAINGLYLGVALELMVFSIALGIRIRDSFLATEKLKDKLIVELQQNEEFIKNENIILEEKVKDRLSEIKSQNVLIEEQSKQALLQQFEKEKLEIQMQALSAQMNPHFIFNCMNAIQHSIVTNNTEKASVMLHDFASLIRMVLENSSQPDIRLEDEIKLLETYLKLEQVRTNYSFDFNVEIDAAISTDFIRIPTMMLQPFLENAIWHGFKFINYKGIINVHFLLQANSICCIITDNGIGRNEARLNNNGVVKKSMAIQIIQNRIGLLNRSLTDNKASLEIIDIYDEHQTAKGTKVIVILPVL